MNRYHLLQQELARNPCTWLVTGVAGFIGSHLLETLLRLEQRVIGLDNLSGAAETNLRAVLDSVAPALRAQFTFIAGDIRSPADCARACQGADYVLHHAAFVSVPKSLMDPLACHEHNVTGFLNVLIAARDARVKRVVYASSSAVYGDSPEAIKVESVTGRPLSPYGASKAMNEAYAAVFASAYGLESVGLRYFNVYGPRQDPNGPYAAVIPRWLETLLAGESPVIYGDGSSSRDFVHVADVVQANLLAATARDGAALNQAYNVGSGHRTTLSELYDVLAEQISELKSGMTNSPARYEPFRRGDIVSSLADISNARCRLGFEPSTDLLTGLENLVRSHVVHSEAPSPRDCAAVL